MAPTPIDRDQLAAEYLEQLPFEPYPIQEEALLAWFTCEQGVLVCAPTGTGKTLIAEAAIYEALKCGRRAYYTTPLIALTEQKFQEIGEQVVQWGFPQSHVGLATGNRRVNPDAPIMIVVAEILFNRLLHLESFQGDSVCAVVMDEFHSFNDPERGMVWELSLGLLPAHVRTLLLSATVGNSREFVHWLSHNHQRKLDLVEGTERKVPLTFQWVGDELLTELVEEMAGGDDANRRTPALIFCFNRDECWNVAEQLKGKKLISDEHKKELSTQLAQFDWSQGAGPKLKQILMRGVGVHHAGILPKYKRIVESLFQRKLLSVCVCTETLSAGINLPARSVVLPNLMKGPPGKKRIIDPSSAHQIFGRAGRPQYDDQGFVYALAHEDDVKILRWKEKYDSIPEDTKDPGLRKAKKALKKKMPTRRATQQYWTEQQFEKLIESPPAKLASRGPLPWRLLAYWLDASPEVAPIRKLISKRLFDGKREERALKDLDQMLLTLWSAGYVELEPKPKLAEKEHEAGLGIQIPLPGDPTSSSVPDEQTEPQPYRAELAYPTESLPKLMMLRSVNPLYGVFLVNQLAIADQAERIQAFESILELPGSVARYVRVPNYEELPPGSLARERLDHQLLSLGIASLEELGQAEPEDDDDRGMFAEERVWPLTLAQKLRRLFAHQYPAVDDVRVEPVWAAGEIIQFGGDFNKYITSKGLQKQEGVLFRHLLRLILMLEEFRLLVPAELDGKVWEDDLDELAQMLIQCCREVDPTSTDKALEEAMAARDAETNGPQTL